MTAATSKRTPVSVFTRLGIIFFMVAALFVCLPQSPASSVSTSSGASVACDNNPTVTSGADSGPGTLRQALVDACADAQIRINGIHITLTSPLVLTQNVFIGGDTTGSTLAVVDGGDTTRVFQVEPGVTATLQAMEIVHGKADHGGAILNLGTLIVNGVTLDHNSATGAGGAIDNQGTLTLNSSTLGYNTAGGSGGGIANSGTLTLDNVTAARNGAPSGGALANTGTLNFKATILADSTTGEDCANSGTLGTNVHNLVEDGSCPAEFSGDPLLSDLNPRFIPIPTFVPLPNSLAIDHAGPGPCSFESDQRSYLRPAFTEGIIPQCDIGATEEQGYLFDETSISGNNQLIAVNTTFPQPLKVLVYAPYDGDETVGGEVTFTSPASGPSTTQQEVTVKLVSDSSSNDRYSYAIFTPTSNGILGTYQVYADFHGALVLHPLNSLESGVYFTVTNCAPHYTVTNLADSGLGSLRYAIQYTCLGGTIDFAPNLSGGTITLDSVLELVRDVTIDGSGLANRITLSGNNAVQVLSVSAGATVHLRSLVITQGKSDVLDKFGGGIVNEGTLTLEASLLTNNTARTAGGIYNTGLLTVTRSEISNNVSSVGFGGGILSERATSGVTIVQSTFSGNISHHGAGIRFAGSYLTVLDSTFSGNGSQDGIVTQYGGAISGVGMLDVQNSTFYNNIATVRGSSLFWSAGLHQTLRNNTFSDTGEAVITRTTRDFTNNLIASGTCILGDRVTASGNLGVHSSCLGTVVASDDLHLGTLADNGGPTQTMALGSGSLAIDAGDDASCTAADQRGYARPIDSHCDAGAYEAPAVPGVAIAAVDKITSTSATLHGTATPNGAETTVTFEYGETDSYGQSTPAGQSPLSSGGSTGVSLALTGLTPNTTYHYRLTATSAIGSVQSDDATFTTLKHDPVAITESASSVTASAATLSGQVHPHENIVDVTFEYGQTSSYGQSVSASPAQLSGDLEALVSAALTGLQPNTTYHFRVVVTTASHAVFVGSDATFTTSMPNYPVWLPLCSK